MILKKGNMWDHLDECDIVIVTGNSTVRNDGHLVMGRGAAHYATTKFKGCARAFGDRIKGRDFYGLIFLEETICPMLGLFQVKNHFVDNAILGIIERSSALLDNFARNEGEGLRIFMNFPGTGWGHLNRSTILPLVKSLPDTIHLWEYR